MQNFGSNNELDEKGHVLNEQPKIKVKFEPKPKPSKCPICTIEYYQQFFNIEQRDVYMRIRCSILSWKPEFHQCVGKNPDLWGPLWISTTIIFILFAGGNLSRFLLEEDKKHFKYEYNYMYVAVLIVYAMAFIIPIILGVIMKYILKSELGVFDIVCMYGYSLSAYIFVLILCIIPYNEAQWFFLMCGLANSTIFLLVNLWDFMKKNKQTVLIAIPIISFNVALILCFKFYFFRLIYAVDD
ncbi:unnamed protein product [Paramecium primaurelia]|uniref:Protein YIPF n=2 Tax=Paramecium TaxID=5884 RepID=A0A8S1VNI0_9CILI|nr:unnamed protein product [Paramecium primaurelia]CAD8176306.1 unnamed protein product [Paramecium pentaurelia]